MLGDVVVQFERHGVRARFLGFHHPVEAPRSSSSVRLGLRQSVTTMPTDRAGETSREQPTNGDLRRYFRTSLALSSTGDF